MVQDRNSPRRVACGDLNVAEARIGLSIITCLLLVLGYVVLQRLGGTRQPPLVEIRSDQSAEQLDAAPQPTPGDMEQPYVLTPEVWEPSGLPIQTTQRPQQVAPQQDVGDNSPGLLNPLEVSAGQFDGSPLDQSEPWRASRAGNPAPVR